MFIGSLRNGRQPNVTSPSVPTAYNPAALLNPRGSNSYTPQSTHNNLHNGFNNSGNSTPVEFSFTTPGSEYVNSPTSQAEATPPSAYGHMIERMNNVEQRTHVGPSVKRRKVETESSIDSQPVQARGGSGVIAQHIKEKRPDGPIHNDNSNSAKKVETVDLTDGSGESDVVEIPPPGETEVCFGMIQRATLNCHKVPEPKPDAANTLGPGYWPTVKLVLNRRPNKDDYTISAYDCSRTVVGAIDAQISKGLAPILDAPRLHVRTACKILSRPKKPGEEIGSAISEQLAVDLVLYGPRKSGNAIGKYLSQKGIWLRKPFVQERDKPYENPQDIEGPRAQPPALKERPSQSVQTGHPLRSVEEIRSEVMGVFDSLTKSEDLPEMIPSPRIQTELLRHQKQGLYFMLKREKPRQLELHGKTADSFWQIQISPRGEKCYKNIITGATQLEAPDETFGGILADMMGLGKTLSILSLVASTVDDADEWSVQPPIQPKAVPKKNTESSRRFDVPITPPLPLTKLRHNGKATLLVCPVSTIANWEDQIKTHIKPGQMTYYIYHGSNRIRDPAILAKYDIVLTTYGSVASEVTGRKRHKPGAYPLEEIGWFRIVLDEAHLIREQNTLTFKAACRLQANRRWAVTGTPVQNKLDDLAALLAFLRLKPFDEKGKFTQFITTPFKVCDTGIVPKLRVLVDSVTLRRLKDKIDLPPRTDQLIKLDFSPSERKLYSLFEKNAQDKITVLSAPGKGMVGGKTYIHILQSILRLRQISAHGKDLLNDADLELVQGMTADSAIDLDEDDEANKAVIAESRAYEAFGLMQETGTDKCCSCQTTIGSNDNSDLEPEREEDVIGHMTICFHLLCSTCIGAWKQEARGRDSGDCPLCSSYIRFECNEIRKSKLAVENEGNGSGKADRKDRSKGGYPGYTGPHTKTLALLEDLKKSQAESEANPSEPRFKSVVLSAWTTHLDLIEIALGNAGIRYTRLDGKMTRVARSIALNDFRDSPDIDVILVSIAAGGLGLNLTAGNSVYVMEPQYNPAAEAQAVDRVHRLGQKRPVRTVRYVMRESIEEKMLELQEKKKKLASLSMDRSRVIDKQEAAKQKLLDLRDLFR
ncbi:SNF2 family N-terminal domain-containing protein [Xylariaceae sp. FL1019]|nr:SNF2 family N-terminal domain-containing protein [Xylariaceae sp. FL1019]